jgi:hypothetical protein
MISFLKKLFLRVGTNVAVVLDNAGWHIAKTVKDYFKKRKVPYIFIIPRAP